MSACVRWIKHKACIYSSCQCSRGSSYADNSVVNYTFKKFSSEPDTVRSYTASAAACRQRYSVRRRTVDVCVDPCWHLLRPAAESQCWRHCSADWQHTRRTVLVCATPSRTSYQTTVAVTMLPRPEIDLIWLRHGCTKRSLFIS